MTQIAECPFGCGPYYLNLRMTGRRIGCVECTKCGATGPEKDSQQGAIDAWNFRSKEPAHVQEVPTLSAEARQAPTEERKWELPP